MGEAARGSAAMSKKTEDWTLTQSSVCLCRRLAMFRTGCLLEAEHLSALHWPQSFLKYA